MLVVSIALLLILVLLIVEARAVNRSVESIRHRIHINGTRGKSTIATYIGAGLHEEGTHTMVKITGVIPTLIHNGCRNTINRSGGARVQEQFKIIRSAAKAQCRNLILECMSIDPGLQQIESRFFRPQIYVITNIRDDHREVMGSTPDSQVRSICDAIPAHCTVITNQDNHLEEISAAAAERNSRLVVADRVLPEGVEAQIPKGIFRENLAIALTACREVDIDPARAAERILREINKTDPRLTLLDKERGIRVLNGFDVNDTDSAQQFLDQWLSEIEEISKVIVVFNTRADRPYRTVLFAQWLANIPDLASVMISGNHRKRAGRALINAGLDRGKISEIRKKEIIQIKKSILDNAGDHTLILTIGNIAGDGFKILNEIT
ncbi:MAG: poly-gamma-glutamate synthase PgsB [Bacteroidota bacterium]